MARNAWLVGWSGLIALVITFSGGVGSVGAQGKKKAPSPVPEVIANIHGLVDLFPDVIGAMADRKHLENAIHQLLFLVHAPGGKGGGFKKDGGGAVGRGMKNVAGGADCGKPRGGAKKGGGDFVAKGGGGKLGGKGGAKGGFACGCDAVGGGGKVGKGMAGVGKMGRKGGGGAEDLNLAGKRMPLAPCGVGGGGKGGGGKDRGGKGGGCVGKGARDTGGCFAMVGGMGGKGGKGGGMAGKADKGGAMVGGNGGKGGKGGGMAGKGGGGFDPRFVAAMDPRIALANPWLNAGMGRPIGMTGGGKGGGKKGR